MQFLRKKMSVLIKIWRKFRPFYKKVFKKNNKSEDKFNKAHQFLLKDCEKITIFDVGAHRGESVERFKKLFPSAEFHVFEPDTDNYSFLTQKFSCLENKFLNNVGVSSRTGKLLFYRNLKSSTSSFHPINTHSKWAKMRSESRGIEPDQFTATSYDVPIINLDRYVKENKVSRINLLKIDTQGHEDEVLKGARKSLEQGKIDIIETELIVGDPYLKNLQFYDIEDIVKPYGYTFYGIDNQGTLLETPYLSFNLIYVHNSLLV